MAPKTLIVNITHAGRRRNIGAILAVLFGAGLLLLAAALPVPWIGRPDAPLTIARVATPARDMIVVDIVNRSPAPATIAQVLVDGAYWEYVVVPSPELLSGGHATLRIPYPWEPGVPHRVVVLSGSGATVEGRLPGTAGSTAFDLAYHWRTLLLGLGIVTALVGLWALWHQSRKVTSP